MKQWFVQKTVINLNYSPEKNGVTRFGVKLSPCPHANEDAYGKMKEQFKSHKASGTCEEVVRLLQ